jgi:signal transduction histidine kinase
MTRSEEFHAFAHDMRRHLRQLVVKAQLALRREPLEAAPAGVREALEQAAAGGLRCDALLAAATAYFTMEARPESRCRLDIALRGAALEMRPHAEALGGELRTRIEVGEETAPRAVAVIAKELLENALKFRRPETPPTVELIAELSETRILLAVRDNGVGIDPAYGAQIFEPFRRLHPPNAYEGFGLGLATAQRLASQLNGEIRLAECEPPGACFVLELPR